MNNIENKLKLLENGLYQHGKEVLDIRRQIDHLNVNGGPNDQKESESQIAEPKASLNKNDMFKDMVINADEYQKCSIGAEMVPPDIQMLDVYKELKFDNIDGGAWKQGWDVKYDPMEFNKHHKLKVFVVPHSHNDPGWIKTFDDYYEHDTKNILYNMLRHLNENPDMKFIWAEISYFSRWYESLSKNSTEIVKKLVKNGQLEFVTGGWVMPDEANSHWLSIAIQLAEGQNWLKQYLNVTPKTSWAIDPFGHSSTMPYILKSAGIEDILIQRTHYSIKKRLALEKQLEFRWRQVWDDSGQTDVFTHMMPFYSYDIPHTCGPDPKICCQFDFKRLPGFGLTCPWRIAPQVITDTNVAKRAELILDQWRKKSTLYKTRSVLIPLGDDFRFTQSTEWESQRKNYEKLFDYMNNEPSLFVEAKFATLQEYFESVHRDKQLTEFPSLSGDFFTYADRDDHYWSGYYTSRPYHKRMDRILLHYIRSAEMMYSWNKWDDNLGFEDLLANATRALSLFQHHDGITGTAKNHVVRDYARMMNYAVKSCKFIMQQAAYRLLTKSSAYEPDYKYTYFHLDESRWPGPDDSRTTIIIADQLPTKHVVFHNSLPQWREELVEFYVSTPYVKVTDFENKKIQSQVSPVWSWHKSYQSNTHPQASNTKFALLFKVKVPPLGMATYIVHSVSPNEPNTGATFANITILTTEPFSVNIGDYPLPPEFTTPREITLRVGDGPSASFSQFGLLKSMSAGANAQTVPMHLEFLKYGTRRHPASSGAYLFLPDGPAEHMILGAPTVLICQGVLESSITTGLPFAVHKTILRGEAVEIRNNVDIGNMGNTEIAMRISTNINSRNVFYTDLNGLQMIKRNYFQKLPLQANYYPISASTYIEDENIRFTILSGQPLGGASLQSGQIEIMQERRLDQDDERGLGQGVLDNQPVIHIFRLLLENLEGCSRKQAEYPGGLLTLQSYRELQTLLHPIDKFVWNDNDWSGVKRSFGDEHEPLDVDFEVGIVRSLPLKYGDKGDMQGHLGLVVHRTNLEECADSGSRVGRANIKRLLNLNDDNNIFSSKLTFLSKNGKVTADDIHFCPMDVKSFIVERR